MICSGSVGRPPLAVVPGDGRAQHLQADRVEAALAEVGGQLLGGLPRGVGDAGVGRKGRVGEVEIAGGRSLDEHGGARAGNDRFRDRGPSLLDLVPGRSGKAYAIWLDGLVKSIRTHDDGPNRDHTGWSARMDSGTRAWTGSADVFPLPAWTFTGSSESRVSPW